MKLHHRLGILAISIQMALPTTSSALVLKPVSIDSAQGEPLYAEIPFSQATGKSPLRVSLAQPFEAGKAQAIDERKFSHLNFYVRQNGKGDGVIVITSTQPVQATAFDLLLKVEDGEQTKVHEVRGKLPSRVDRLQQQIEPQKLKPRVVDAEQEKQLNLPTVSAQVGTDEKPLPISENLPPPLLAKNGTERPSSSNDTSNAQKDASANLNIGLSAIANNPNMPTAPSLPSEVINQTVMPDSYVMGGSRKNTNQDSVVTSEKPASTKKSSKQGKQNTANATAAQKKGKNNKNSKAPADNQNADPADQHIVQANQSVWEIAQQIAIRKKLSTDKVMQQIYENNQDAFINGQINMLKQGAVLSLPYEYQAAVRPASARKKREQQAQQREEQQAARQERRKQRDEQQQAKAEQARQTAPKPVTPPTTQPSVTPPAQQAQLSVVANNTGTASGTEKGTVAGVGKVTQGMVSQIKSLRLSAWEVQSRVKTLDQQLKEKQQRIAILNARLAEIQQQLNSNQANKTTTSSNNNAVQKTTASAIATTGLASLLAMQTDLSSLTVFISGLIS